MSLRGTHGVTSKMATDPQGKKQLYLRKHQQAQESQGCQVRLEDLEHLQDHGLQWGQPHPGKRPECAEKNREQNSPGPGSSSGLAA